MTTTAAVLFAAADLTNASALLYTSPAAGNGTWIDKAIAVNHSGATRQITMNVVAPAGAAASSNLAINAKSLADKATYLCPELIGVYLPPGASIYGFADAGAGVAFRMSGREITA